MKKLEYTILGTSLTLAMLATGCGGGGTQNPVNILPAPNPDARLSGNIGIVTQVVSSTGNAASSEGLVGFDGIGDTSAATFNTVAFTNGVAASTTTAINAGTYAVSAADNKTFVINNSSVLGGTTITDQVNGLVANNSSFAAGVVSDSNKDTGIALAVVPLANATNASLKGTFNTSLSNAGNNPQTISGTITFDGLGGITPGTTFVSSQGGGSVTVAANSTYTVNANGTMTATLVITDGNNTQSNSINGILGQDGTLIFIAANNKNGSTVGVATQGPGTGASNADLSGTVALFGAGSEPTNVGNVTTFSGNDFVASLVANGAGLITSGTVSAFRAGVTTPGQFNATGTYAVNSNGTFSNFTLTQTGVAGGANVTANNLIFNTDKSYAVGVAGLAANAGNNFLLTLIK